MKRKYVFERLRAAAALALLIPVASLGCGPKETDFRGPLASSAGALTAQDMRLLGDTLAANPAYVALQQQSITMMHRALVATMTQPAVVEAALESPQTTEAQLLALLDATPSDLATLQALAQPVREQLPWLAEYGPDVHVLALTANPTLFASFEAALSSHPSTAEILDPTVTSTARAATLRDFVLESAGDLESSASASIGHSTNGLTAEEAQLALHSIELALVAVAVACLVIAVLTLDADLLGAALVAAALALAIHVAEQALAQAIVILADLVQAFTQSVRNFFGRIADAFRGGGGNGGQDPNECHNDQDCPPNAYCKLGPLGIGTNVCASDKAINRSCSRSAQCANSCCKIYWGVPLCRPC